MEQTTFELLEWRDRRYQHVKFFRGTKKEAEMAASKLNEGYSGPRFVFREVSE